MNIFEHDFFKVPMPYKRLEMFNKGRQTEFVYFASRPYNIAVEVPINLVNRFKTQRNLIICTEKDAPLIKQYMDMQMGRKPRKQERQMPVSVKLMNEENIENEVFNVYKFKY